ncbi:hypothetical protein KJ780_00905 [Candidatus Micrarchaeota archaeon]|nr:hypothetical protein [Candidatus Micrarchaeota archaeon]
MKKPRITIMKNQRELLAPFRANEFRKEAERITRILGGRSYDRIHVELQDMYGKLKRGNMSIPLPVLMFLAHDEINAAAVVLGLKNAGEMKAWLDDKSIGIIYEARTNNRSIYYKMLDEFRCDDGAPPNYLYTLMAANSLNLIELEARMRTKFARIKHLLISKGDCIEAYMESPENAAEIGRIIGYPETAIKSFCITLEIGKAPALEFTKALIKFGIPLGAELVMAPFVPSIENGKIVEMDWLVHYRKTLEEYFGKEIFVVMSLLNKIEQIDQLEKYDFTL